jgi:transposase-like protein
MALERKYSVELKAEALAMVDELRERDPGDRSVVRTTATALGVGEQSLRSWLKTREKREAQRAAREAGRGGAASGIAGAAGAAASAHLDTDGLGTGYAGASEELERELAYLRGECARLRAAINALISP